MNDIYLEALESFGVLPNFWCSSEYFEKAEWVTHQQGNKLQVKNPEGMTMLPSIDIREGIQKDSCWAGFSGMRREGKPLLDFEFIYDPVSFQECIPASKYKMIRKNIKWALEDIGCTLHLVFSADLVDSKVIDFLQAWNPSWKDDESFDSEVFAQYLVNGNNRLFVVDYYNKVWGELVYDYNWKFINFRYCIVMSGIRGLSDYARILFYDWVSEKYPGIFVNDGGSLGRDGLYQYKMRLCPVKVNEIQCWL